MAQLVLSRAGAGHPTACKPRLPVPPAEAAWDSDRDIDFEERAAIVEYDAGVLREWAEGFARLDRSRPLLGFTAARWQRMIDDGGRFIDCWAAIAVEAGWTAQDVFGVHPGAPAARLDAMGLVPLISGGEVVDVTATAATIKDRGGSLQVYRLRRSRPDAVAVWDMVEPESRS